MNSLTTFDDSNNLMDLKCQNINIYMMIIIISLIFLIIINWIYFLCLKTNKELEVKINKIDKNLLTLMKIFRELKKID